MIKNDLEKKIERWNFRGFSQLILHSFPDFIFETGSCSLSLRLECSGSIMAHYSL